MSEKPEKPVSSYDLVVSLGTDYHHFDRLVEWVEDFLRSNPEVTCLFQHGFTRAPQGADGVERMPRTELLGHYQRAKVVLVQGGPGSILDAREVGLIPFAVPRLKEFDEVVDNHQVQFSKVMESRGETIIATDSQDLAQKLKNALANPDSVRAEPRVAESDVAANNLAEALPKMYQQHQEAGRKIPRRMMHVLRSFVEKPEHS